MKKILCTLTAFLLLFAVFPGAGAGAKEPVTLNLALYTVIPDYDSFEETVKAYWAETHPETELNIVDWDCYSGGHARGSRRLRHRRSRLRRL